MSDPIQDVDAQYNLMLHNAETLLEVLNGVAEMLTKSDDDVEEVSELKQAVLKYISGGLKKLTNPMRH